MYDSAPFGAAGDKLPLGPPMLEWSFNRDGEMNPAMKEQRDRRLGVRMEDKRLSRADLTPLAKPQQGVDAMKDQFRQPTTSLPGVTDQRPAAK